MISFVTRVAYHPPMATDGSYARLLAWSENADEAPKVTRNGGGGGESWSIAVSVSDPVTFTAHGSAGTIDEAAEQIIDQLTKVGVTVE